MNAAAWPASSSGVAGSSRAVSAFPTASPSARRVKSLRTPETWRATSVARRRLASGLEEGLVKEPRAEEAARVARELQRTSGASVGVGSSSRVGSGAGGDAGAGAGTAAAGGGGFGAGLAGAGAGAAPVSL